MKNLISEMINATKERVQKDAISAEELIETIKTVGFAEEAAVKMVNDANEKRIIRIIFSLSARTAEPEEIGAGHTVVTLL